MEQQLQSPWHLARLTTINYTIKWNSRKLAFCDETMVALCEVYVSGSVLFYVLFIGQYTKSAPFIS